MAKFLSRYAELTLCLKPAVAGKTPGKHARFSRSQFETSDPETIEAIRQHPDFGVTIWEEAAAEEAKRKK